MKPPPLPAHEVARVTCSAPALLVDALVALGAKKTTPLTEVTYRKGETVYTTLQAAVDLPEVAGCVLHLVVQGEPASCSVREYKQRLAARAVAEAQRDASRPAAGPEVL